MKKTEPKKTGRPPRHGGYSIVYKDEVIKRHPKLRQYIQNCRDGLVRDVAGSEDALSEQQRIMIDRIVSRLSICRLIECYIEKYGAFRQDRIRKDKVLELEPALGINYLAFSNSIDRALIALGLNRKKANEALDLGQYIEEKYGKKKEARAKATGQGKASEGGEGDDQGEIEK